MDTSVEYIEMCSSAKEIQTKYVDGYDEVDYVHVPQTAETAMAPFIEMAGMLVGKKIHLTLYYNFWLPTQDQLQEIAFGKNPTHPTVVNEMYHFMTNVVVKNNWRPESMEQFMLMLVMLKCHSLQWSRIGSNWILSDKKIFPAQ